MKKIKNQLIFLFSFMSLFLIGCEDNSKDIKNAVLVPVYKVQITAASAANNTESGYKSITVPSSVHIYQTRDLVINYTGTNGDIDYVESTDTSTSFIPNETDATQPGTPGKYAVKYTVVEDEIVSNDEDNSIVTTTNEETEYSVEIDNTDALGVDLDPVSGLGLTVTNTKVVVIEKPKAEGDVAQDPVVLDSTDDVGEVTTTVAVNDTTTTTTITTVSTAVFEIEVDNTEEYN